MSLSQTPEIRVNQDIISPAQLDAEVQYHPAASRREAMIKAAETLIINQVLKQRATVLGLESNKSGSQQEQEDALIDSLLAREVMIPQASEQECLHYFAANRDKFCTAPLLEVRHILIAAAPDDVEGRVQAKQTADAVRQKLAVDGGNFADLARNYSACPSKEVEGSLGQISQGQTVPEFERQVFAAEPGLMQQAVESRYGFHLVWVNHKVEGKALPYELVASKIKHYLDEKVRRKAIAQYIQLLIADADIQGFEFNLDASPLVQ